MDLDGPRDAAIPVTDAFDCRISAIFTFSSLVNCVYLLTCNSVRCVFFQKTLYGVALPFRTGSVVIVRGPREDSIGIMEAPTDKINSAAKLQTAVSTWLREGGKATAAKYVVENKTARGGTKKVSLTDETLLAAISPISTEYSLGAFTVYLG